METYEAKQALRKEVASSKRSYTKSTLSDLSTDILERLEQHPLFEAASTVALYHALPGEVQTAAFIEKWGKRKKILLPVVDGDDLRLLPYQGADSLHTGAFGILEPTCDDTMTGESLSAEKEIELIIVPGIAFDRHLNRLGRGKGYYDRLLSTLSADKIGLCFDFQLRDTLPVEPFDKKMDVVITEKETIGQRITKSRSTTLPA